MTTIYLLFLLIAFPAGAMAVDISQVLDRIGDPFEEKIPKPAVSLPIPATSAAMVMLPVVQEVTTMATQPVQMPSQSINLPPPPALAPQEKPNFTVEGIIWSDTIHAAVINGQLISVGDRIADAVVIDVNRDGVVVDVKGTRFTLPVQ